MENKYKKHYIKNIFIPFITAILSYFAKSSCFFNTLAKFKIPSETISNIQEYCLLGSIILSSLIISVTLFRQDNKIKIAKVQSENLIAMVKDSFNKTINSELNQEIDFNVRIFVPHKSFYYKLMHRINKNHPLEFVIKNYANLAKSDKTNELRFIVEPKDQAQGLVGKTYTSRKIVYDNNLYNNNDTTYNLNEYQISKTNDLKFSLTCPIMDSHNNIVSIVAFDTTNSVNINQRNENTISRAVNNFSRLLYDSIPDYFKPEGGLL